jgi:hypothetical protein
LVVDHYSSSQTNKEEMAGNQLKLEQVVPNKVIAYSPMTDMQAEPLGK